MEVLSGKALDDFNEWLLSDYYTSKLNNSITCKLKAISFKNKKFEERYGVYEKWLDNNDIHICLGFRKGKYRFTITDSEDLTLKLARAYDKRVDAQSEAIQIGSKIYNSRQKDK